MSKIIINLFSFTNKINLYFTYRWLLLECKREFPFNEALRVLEVMWATLPIDTETPELSEISLLPLSPSSPITDCRCSRRCQSPQRRALSCPQLTIIDESFSRKNRHHSSSLTYYSSNERSSSSLQREDSNSTSENDECKLYSSIINNKSNSTSTKSREKSFENSFSLDEISEFDSDNLSTCSNDNSKDINNNSKCPAQTHWVHRLPTNNTMWLEEDNSFLIFLCIAILLAHRTHLLKQKNLDEQEISMHFDRYRRRHNAERLLKCARNLYAQYIQWARKKRMLDDLNSFSAS